MKAPLPHHRGRRHRAKIVPFPLAHQRPLVVKFAARMAAEVPARAEKLLRAELQRRIGALHRQGLSDSAVERQVKAFGAAIRGELWRIGAPAAVAKRRSVNGKRRMADDGYTKQHRSYSVEETAGLLRVHKNTVRNWLKQGLASIDDRRPILILGRELSRFLHERRQKAKQSCGPGRIFCIACRAPKVPAGKMADCTATSPLAGSLCGICPDCGRLIYRRINLAKIDAVRGELEIAFTQPHPRLGESAILSVNCDSSQKAQANENA